jgi:hypothetical protein
MIVVTHQNALTHEVRGRVLLQGRHILVDRPLDASFALRHALAPDFCSAHDLGAVEMMVLG